MMYTICVSAGDTSRESNGEPKGFDVLLQLTPPFDVLCMSLSKAYIVAGFLGLGMYGEVATPACDDAGEMSAAKVCAESTDFSNRPEAVAMYATRASRG